MCPRVNIRHGRRDKEETKCPPDELIKHLFNGFHPFTKTRLARTTGRSRMNLGDKGSRVYLGLTLGLCADKRPSLETALAKVEEEEGAGGEGEGKGAGGGRGEATCL